MQLIRLCDSKIPNMHLLKYYVMQADRMLKEYSPQVETTFAAIPRNIRDIMGDTSTYDVAFDISPSLPQAKTPCSKLKARANDDDCADDLSLEESSDGNEEEEEEEMELDGSDNEYNFGAKDVPEDGDDITLYDPDGLTLTGRFMKLWQRSRENLLHVIACVAHILSPNPVVQAYTKENMVSADLNAAEFLIGKWLLPKNIVGNERDRMEAEMILDFHNEFSKYFCLKFFSHI